ncbi:MAG: VOC family protein [Desulfobacterales bacterium]|jgi:catechol 2,3-dioxygenase-like lactoylglutathione lyase family enzyme
MLLKHVALTYGSEEHSDRFFKHLLGLAKEEPKALATSLGKAIFNVDTELTMINYRGENLHFEIFITGKPGNQVHQIGHVCLAVRDLKAFVNKSHQLGMEVIQVPKGDRTLTFIRDDEGHLFEIK